MSFRLLLIVVVLRHLMLLLLTMIVEVAMMPKVGIYDSNDHIFSLKKNLECKVNVSRLLRQ